MAPGETDTTAYAALFLLFAIVFVVFHFYARFDRYAEEHNEGTPLKTTVPMLLTVAFAYEIFPPLRHFSILLPTALIVTALARDLMLWFEPRKEHAIIGELDDRLAAELAREREEAQQAEPPAAKFKISEAEKPANEVEKPAKPLASPSAKTAKTKPAQGEAKDD